MPYLVFYVQVPEPRGVERGAGLKVLPRCPIEPSAISRNRKIDYQWINESWGKAIWKYRRLDLAVWD